MAGNLLPLVLIGGVAVVLSKKKKKKKKSSGIKGNVVHIKSESQIGPIQRSLRPDQGIILMVVDIEDAGFSAIRAEIAKFAAANPGILFVYVDWRIARWEAGELGALYKLPGTPVGQEAGIKEVKWDAFDGTLPSFIENMSGLVRAIKTFDPSTGGYDDWSTPDISRPSTPSSPGTTPSTPTTPSAPMPSGMEPNEYKIAVEMMPNSWQFNQNIDLMTREVLYHVHPNLGSVETDPASAAAYERIYSFLESSQGSFAPYPQFIPVVEITSLAELNEWVADMNPGLLAVHLGDAHTDKLPYGFKVEAFAAKNRWNQAEGPFISSAITNTEKFPQMRYAVVAFDKVPEAVEIVMRQTSLETSVDNSPFFAGYYGGEMRKNKYFPRMEEGKVYSWETIQQGIRTVGQYILNM